MNIQELFATNDPDIIELADEVVEASRNYVSAVIAAGRINLVARNLDENEFRIRYGLADERRTRAHNGLIACVDALNRLIKSKGEAPIPVEKGVRRSYALLAINIVSNIYIDTVNR